jgi:hypothetical protein
MASGITFFLERSDQGRFACRAWANNPNQVRILRLLVHLRLFLPAQSDPRLVGLHHPVDLFLPSQDCKMLTGA